MTQAGEEAVRAYAAAKRFAAPTLARWLAQPPTAAAALLEVAERLRLNENQFRDLLDDVVDIAVRRGGEVAQVLDDPAVQGVWARHLGRNEAIKALRAVMRRLRYPQLSRAEQQLATLIKALRLPLGAQLGLPAMLEGDHVTLTVRAASAAELRRRTAAAATALRDPQLEALFDVLEGRW